MEKDMMILAKDQYYSLDCFETKLNNNVMVVGAAGAGKTRSIVTPNLLQATGSYIVTDPKGNLYNQYADYLKEQGYVVKKLDFTEPMNSHHYNFFNYIHSTQDIVKIAHMLIYQHRGKGTLAETVADYLKLPFCRFDMSEYADKESNLQFCGSGRVYKNGRPGAVTSFVHNNPECVLLFDEVEKAHSVVIHLFLQMLDAGRVRDAFLEKEISFERAIIIFTTNAGRDLYEESEKKDLSGYSRKVVLRALQKDMNPQTREPYFPAAICSRFAFGNVVMFNHLPVQRLQQVVENEILSQTQQLKKELDIEVKLDDKVYSAILFAEGASVDARVAKGSARSFYNNEIYELLRLIDSDNVKTKVKDVEEIQVGLDFGEAEPEIRLLFENDEPASILVFAKEDIASLCREKLSAYHVIVAEEYEAAVDIIKNKSVEFILLDMKFGLEFDANKHLNIEDMNSQARDFYQFLQQTESNIPIYLLECENAPYTEEDRTTFTRQGVRDIVCVDDENLVGRVDEIAAELYQQNSMERLAKQNKLVTFETSQSVSEDGKKAQINLFDFKLMTAIDAGDTDSVLDALSKPDVNFKDIIGAESVKEELSYFVGYLKNPKKYIGTGVKAPKGVLLYGPPGTGKTLLAKAMAAESDVTFLAVDGNQFLKSYVGEGPAKVHAFFKTARKYAPAILFVDEIDAIAKNRQNSDVNKSGDALTAFLTEMDGFHTDTTRPVFVLAATNYDLEQNGANSLDPALLRRFDRRVLIDLPNKTDRIAFLNKKRQENSALDISDGEIETIALRSTGMSLASLDSVVEYALRSAIRQESTTVTDSILEEAFESFNGGDIKKWNPEQLKQTAYHEAGHAFVSWKCGVTPAYITIVARGSHGGYVQYAENEKETSTKEELLARIRAALAGRAAELVYYGKDAGVTTGASGDLRSATRIAKSILCSFGMDDDFGLATMNWMTSDEGKMMPPELRSAVNKILKEEMKKAITIIEENRESMDKLVEALMEKNHMVGKELDELLNAVAKGV